ncbi:MAG: PEGA domain-containing protein [bacterium]
MLLCLAVGLTLAAKTCPQCGTSNPDNARFCKSCGYSFPARSRPQAQPALRVEVSVGALGEVSVNSTPEGAAVRVGGTRRGTTPLVLTDLAPGRHELELTRAGYRDYRGSLEVPEPAGVIKVTTIPSGAQLVVDGRSVGSVPDTGMVVTGLGPGSHTVVARLPGRPDQEREVVISEVLRTVALRIDLPMAEGFLLVESDPRGANVIVDGQGVGRTSYFGALAPADYRLELALGGFRPWISDVNIRLGDTTAVSAVLAPMRVRRWGLLATGVAGIAGGVIGAVLGESSYREYVAADTSYRPDEVAGLRQRTIAFDWVRNLAGGLGILSLGAFVLF